VDVSAGRRYDLCSWSASARASSYRRVHASTLWGSAVSRGQTAAGLIASKLPGLSFSAIDGLLWDAYVSLRPNSMSKNFVTVA